ncbi:MAG: GAF domain-containing protein, partial [Chloroflexota bacterium]|nr:GAF domain-containing protein [Chloroflexota bacterium]
LSPSSPYHGWGEAFIHRDQSTNDAMTPRARSFLLRYGMAVATSALALLLGLRLGPWIEASPFPLFLGAVTLSAWYGGLGPGLLATILGGIISAVFFLPPFASPMVATVTNTTRLIIFTLVAILISSLNSTLRDARRRAEAATEELRTLQTITDTALAQLGLEDLLRELLGRICQALGADVARIMLLAEDGQHLVPRMILGADLPRNGTARLRLGEGIAGRIALRREPLIVDDVAALVARPSLLHAAELRSLVGAPLLVEGRLVGVIDVGTYRYHQFRAEDARLLQLVADRVAIAIDHARLHEIEEHARAEARVAAALRARALQQAGVVELGQQALTGAAFDELLDRAVIMVAGTLGVEYCKVLELEADGSALRLRAGVGWRDGLVGTATVDAGPGSQAGYTLISGGPVIVEDLREETRFTGPPLLHEHGVVSGLSVIIPGREWPFGVLGAHTVTRRAFNQDDVHFLQAIANVLATVVDRKRAEEERAQLIREQAARAEAEAAQQRFAFLAEASRALAASLDYEATLAAVAQLAVPRLADYCVVDVVDANGQVRRVATAHADPAKASLVAALCDYPPDRNDMAGIGKVLRTGEAEILAEIPPSLLEAESDDGRQRETMLALAPRSAMIVPLLARGRTLGAIALFHAESGRRYDDGDLAFVRELAGRAALAVDNARLYREAQHAVRVRDEFLAAASHELRTPLSHVKGFVSSLRQADVDWDEETRQDFLAEAEREADRLAKLIGDLLDMTRLESGELDRVTRVPVAPVAIVAGGLDRVRGLVGDHPLDVCVPSDLAPVLGDSSQLERVVANLVENAAKYSPPDAPIRVSVEQTDGTLVLCVDDDGPGIPDQYLEQIFDKFFRVRSERAPVPGTGLGLAICRRIVEAHGGRIHAENRPEGGARLVVTLPALDSPDGRRDDAPGHPGGERRGADAQARLVEPQGVGP